MSSTNSTSDPQQWQSSYFLETDNKDKPLNPKNASLNETLQTQYLDLDDHDDSVNANLTRNISKCVGSVCTPRQVLGLLRVLKAITLSFLVLTVLSNLTYVLLVETISSDAVQRLAGGSRDKNLRLYALGLTLLGVAVELDYSKVMKKFSGLKGFLPRALLYFFIAQLTATRRATEFARGINGDSAVQQQQQQQSDDAAAADGDDANAAAVDDKYSYETGAVALDEVNIPSSAISFQRVTSFVLCLCAFGYLVCGLLCFDRFTARAFLSTKDASPRPDAVSSAGPSSQQQSAQTPQATHGDAEEEESTTASSSLP